MTRTDDPVVERLRAADPLPLDDLDRLLRQMAMPDPPTSPAGRGAPARRGRRVLWGAVTAAAVTAVAGVLVVSLPRGEERAAIPGHIGILDRPATDADRLPEWVRGEWMTLEQGIDRDGARLAASTATHRYYIAPAAGGRVCLVDVPTKPPPLPRASGGYGGGPGASVGGIQCADDDVFARRFMIVVVGYRVAARDLELVGVVPDGYDRATMGATTAQVHDNLFILRPPRLGPAVRITGPAGVRIAYHQFSVGPFIRRIPKGLDTSISVFQRAASADDVPPPALEAALAAARVRPAGMDPEPGTERRVATGGRTTYWLIRDRFTGRGRRALLAMVRGRGVVLRPIALPTAAVPFRADPSTSEREPYGLTKITMRTVVPDGFTSAVVAGRTFPVRNNFLLVRGFPTGGQYRVELRGPAGRILMSTAPGPNEFRLNIPTNDVPYRSEALVVTRAGQAGLTGRLTATIVAGLRGDVAGLLGSWARTTPNPYQRTVPVVVVRGANGALALVIESASGSNPVFLERRYRADQVPDLSVLGRVRPLKLD